jgi:hypothetical protein
MRTYFSYTFFRCDGLRKSGILPDTADGPPAGRFFGAGWKPASVKMTDFRSAEGARLLTTQDLSGSLDVRHFLLQQRA